MVNGNVVLLATVLTLGIGILTPGINANPEFIVCIAVDLGIVISLVEDLGIVIVLEVDTGIVIVFTLDMQLVEDLEMDTGIVTGLAADVGIVIGLVLKIVESLEVDAGIVICLTVEEDISDSDKFFPSRLAKVRLGVLVIKGPSISSIVSQLV